MFGSDLVIGMLTSDPIRAPQLLAYGKALVEGFQRNEEMKAPEAVIAQWREVVTCMKAVLHLLNPTQAAETLSLKPCLDDVVCVLKSKVDSNSLTAKFRAVLRSTSGWIPTVTEFWRTAASSQELQPFVDRIKATWHETTSWTTLLTPAIVNDAIAVLPRIREGLKTEIVEDVEKHMVTILLKAVRHFTALTSDTVTADDLQCVSLLLKALQSFAVCAGVLDAKRTLQDWEGSMMDKKAQLEFIAFLTSASGGGVLSNEAVAEGLRLLRGFRSFETSDTRLLHQGWRWLLLCLARIMIVDTDLNVAAYYDLAFALGSKLEVATSILTDIKRIAHVTLNFLKERDNVVSCGETWKARAAKDSRRLRLVSLLAAQQELTKTLDQLVPLRPLAGAGSTSTTDADAHSVTAAAPAAPAPAASAPPTDAATILELLSPLRELITNSTASDYIVYLLTSTLAPAVSLREPVEKMLASSKNWKEGADDAKLLLEAATKSLLRIKPSEFRDKLHALAEVGLLLTV